MDIGTDHAFLPCFLAERGAVSHAIAADIADGPLEAARHTVLKSGLEDRVDVLKSDGFKDIPGERLLNVTDAVIAGMGGELIVRILSEAGDFPKAMNLILQPNSRAEVLRRWLAENGYCTLRESAVRDGKFVYAVINARYDGKKRQAGRVEAITGKIDPAESDGREYFLSAAAKLETAAQGMAAGKSPESAAEASKLMETAREIREKAGRA